MRVVLDTNVLISAFIARKSVPAQVVDLLRTEELFLLQSQEVFAELQRVLEYPHLRGRFHYTDEQAARFLQGIRNIAQWVDVQETLSVVVEDESDNRLIELAVAGRARYIVTGDRKHLLKIRRYRAIEIVSPAEFLALFRAARN